MEPTARRGTDPDRARPSDPGPGEGVAGAPPDGSGRARRPFAAGRTTPEGSWVWFFPRTRASPAPPVPVPGPWTLRLLLRKE